MFLKTIWHSFRKHKAKHYQETISLPRQNCTNLGVQRALLPITVLALTGVFLRALIQRWSFPYLKSSGINNLSIRGWTAKLVQHCISTGTDTREDSFLLYHAWISSFKNSFLVSNPLAWLLQIWPSTRRILLVNLLPRQSMLAHLSKTKEPQQARLPAAALVYMENYLLQIQVQFLVLSLTDAIINTWKMVRLI